MDPRTGRIVSLLPAATEILSFLELEENLVGVSSDCDWPPMVKQLPAVSVTDIDDTQPSGSIDRQVREKAHHGKSLYHVETDVLESLEPDLVITQEQCDVCAPTFDEVRDSCRRLKGNPDVLSLEANTLSEVLETITAVGEATGTEDRASELVRELREKQRLLTEQVPSGATSPKVACIEWYDPPFRSGHWVPEMVELLGGEPLGEPGSHSEEMNYVEIADFDPEILVLMPCGFQTERAVTEGERFLERLNDRTGFNSRDRTVYAVNGSFYFSRPGPRLWDGMVILQRIMNPGTQDTYEIPESSFSKLV